MAKYIVNYRPWVVKKLAEEFGRSPRNIRDIFAGKFVYANQPGRKKAAEEVLLTAQRPPYNCTLTLIEDDD